MLRGNPHESGIGSSDINAHVTRIPLSVDSASHRVTIPDTELLFSAKFTKAGSDLVLTGEDGHKIVLAGYFDQPRHADLVAPGGAILTADVVAKLTISQTPGQYAQAGAPAGAVAIGKVERLGGSATVQHANGSVEELHVGDNVYQGDVVETRGGSQLGMSFMDGTAFNMGATARMVLSELVYDSNSNSNSGVFSLVKGTISFVAGKAAKTGDMRVETPVATMGIRGTSVNTNITTDVGGNTVSVTYSLMTDPDGHVGSFNILDRVTGAIIGTITTTDTTFVVTPTANLGVLATQLNKTPEQIAQELAAAQVLFPIFLANPENFNNQNVNPQNNHHGSGTPQGGSQPGTNGGLGTGTGNNGNVTRTDGGQNGTGTGGNFHVDLPHVNQAPSVFADVPTHLVEAVSLGDQGAATALSHITKIDLDGTVSYNTFAMAGDGWIYFGNGIYSKLGTYGAASLNAGGASVAALVADNWHDLGNGFLEKTVSFGASGNATIRISAGVDTVTYALDNNKADPLRQIDHPTETFVIPVVDDSNATATTTIVFTVDGRNDPPSIVIGSTNATGGVTEDTSPTVLTTAGTITFKDAELTDTHTLTGTPAVPSSVTVTDGNGNSEPLPGFNPAGDYLGTFTLTVVENPNDASNIGTVQWSFSVNDDDPLVQALAVGQVITQVYTITIDDGQGGSVQQQITVTITGSNDDPNNSAPVIVAGSTVTGAFDELTSPSPSTGLTATDSVGGTIKFLDIDLIDSHAAAETFVSAVWTKAGGGGTESISDPGGLTLSAVHEILTDTDNQASVDWTYSAVDANLDFLAAGETLVVTYDIKIQDNTGSFVVQPVTVTITGTNDVPKISVVGSNTSSAAVTETNAPLSTSGALSVSDADVTNTVTASVYDLSVGGTGLGGKPASLTLADLKAMLSVDNGNVIDNTHTTGTIHWSFASAPQAFDFLRDGQTLILTYTVRAIDSDLSHAIADQVVTVTITGTNDLPILSAITPPAAVIEATNASAQDIAAIHGSLSVSDLDVGDTLTASIVGSPVVKLDGDAFTLPAGAAALITGALTFDATATSDGGGKTIGWTYDPAAANLDFLRAGQSLTLTYTVKVNDGLADSGTQNIVVTITGTNDAPVMDLNGATAGINATLAYTENDALTAIAPTSTVTDIDSADFDGGSLTVSFTAAGLLEDQLSILTDGSVDVTGNAVSVDGNQIGTIAAGQDGANGASLRIDLSGSFATPGAVTTLMHHIGYSNNSDNPSAAARTVEFQIVDGDGVANSGHDRAQVSATINVMPVNDAPVFTGTSGTTAFIEQSALVAVVNTVSVSDIDSVNYDHGSLTATVTNGGHQGDTLSIAADQYIKVDSGGHVMFDADGAGGVSDFVEIGTLTDGINSLTIDLNSAATDAAVADLVKAIQFGNASSDDPTNAVRKVTFTLKDGGGTDNNGQDSTFFNAFVAVTPVNDAPTFTGDSATIAFVELGSPVAVATNVAVSDVDNTNFNGGSLTAAIGATGSHAGDALSLAINDHFTVDTGGNVMFDSDGVGGLSAVAIGHLTNNGTSLTVDLNSNATADAVVALVQDIQFSSASHDPTADARTVTFTLNDGGGTAHSGHDTTSFNAIVNVTPVNDAPAFGTADLTGAVTEYNNTFVTNGDMQSPTLAPDTFPVGSFAGWTATAGAGLWRPSSHFTSSQLPDYNNGAQVAYINTGSLSQDIGVVLPSTVYTIGVDLYGRDDAAAGTPYQFELLIGGQHVGLVQTGTGPDAGLAQHLNLTFDTTGLNLGGFTIGQTAVTLVVSESAANAQLVLDNVTLTTSKLYDTGTIAFTDADTADAHLVSSSAIGTTFGMLSTALTTDTTGIGTGGLVTWTYQLTDPSAVASLTAGQTAVDSFLVTIDDQHGGTVTRQVDVTLTGTNHQPVATDDSFIVNDSGAGTLPSLGAILKSNDDTDGNDSFSITSVSAVSGGGLDSINGGDPTFTPPSTAATSTFTYTTTNASGTVTTATVTVDVQAGTTLTGTTGNDTLISSPGNQTMTGGAGADTFVFAGTIGNDTIADFTPGTDKINIDPAIIADFNTLLSLTDDTSGNSIVTIDQDNSITLTGVLKTALINNQGDFHFV